MQKDSRPSSVAGSAHLSPRDLREGTPIQEPEQLREAYLTTSSSALAVDDLGISAEDNTDNTRATESQPMATSNSTSSDASLKEAGTSGTTGPAAPYGTRSRNRAGNPRPNYAEDKDVDAEFELPMSAKVGRGARPGEQKPLFDTGRQVNTTRKAQNSEPDQVLSVHSHHKEPIPGTSSFLANPAGASSSQPSKKRKATVQPAATAFQSQLQVPVQNGHSSQVSTRRASMAAQGFRESNMLSFIDCAGRPRGETLVADDGTVLEVNDHVYLVCEPPGEPYYLGRIMEFLHTNNDSTQPIDALRLNWYYRPKDIGRKVNDTRQVFASMHSDISPLTAIRGKCQIKHKSEVEKLDDLRKTKDSFWYEKLYDRYIHRFYDVIPTSQVINVPVEVKTVLDERWKYIVVEPGRGRELTSAVKTCKRCNKYCASNDSVDCAVCRNTYHMSCVSPPLLKKPSRGFAWACGPCSKAQEKKLEARNTPNIADAATDRSEGEEIVEDEESPGALGESLDTGRTSPTICSEAEASSYPGTAEQVHQASLWLFRYLGIHCKVEDALDYDDRIYPRASSRLGPRHQANIVPWSGRPVEYVKPTEIKRKYVKSGIHKKNAVFSKETMAALEADKIAKEKRPKWVMDEPPGYINRGEDYDNDDMRNTARLLYKLPESAELPASVQNGAELDEFAREQLIFKYMADAAQLAPSLGLPELSTNLLDVALQTLRANGYNADKALGELQSLDQRVFKEPDLNGLELKKFEDGVSKYGSEWHSIKKHVKTISAADIVRFYYTWKKSARGKHIWGNYSGRKGKKEAKRAEASMGKLQDDVADDYDDSAFDNDKAFEKKRGFQCKFCSTRSSRQWRRAPNTAAGTMVPEIPGGKVTGKDKCGQLMVALCRRCAELWRRYAIQWEDVDEMAKKVAQAGGRTWKRKIDEELLKELVAANEVINQAANVPSAPVSAGGTPVPATLNFPTGIDVPRKRTKGLPEIDSTDPAMYSAGVVTPNQKKKGMAEKPHAPPAALEMPKPKILPCAICGGDDSKGERLSCRECRMTVHRNCYGIVGDNRSPNKWVCDMCSNDKNPQVSVQYKCMLCPVEYTEQDFLDLPKTVNKKKGERERERDRAERENAQKVADFFRKKQEELNKPVNSREPLKRTANNNWVHVTCAVFTPEVKFGNAKALEPSEGIPSVASARYDEICKACKQKGGACVACHVCKAPVHVECAHQNGYTLGFDITPVKGSRRDQFSIVNIGSDAGTMTAAIWCKEHHPLKTIVYPMQDVVDEATGLNVLQLYVQNYKQADLTLTGTVRKATLVNQSTKAVNTVASVPLPNRRASTATNTNGSTGRASVSQLKPEDHAKEGSAVSGAELVKKCVTCEIEVSPKWWPFLPAPANTTSTALASIESNGDATRGDDPPTTNDNVIRSLDVETGHAALAAAALDQNTSKASPTSTELQCHQCHWKKVRKDPTPPPVVPVAVREPSHPPIETPSSISAPAPDTDSVQTSSPSHYTWPQPPSYPTTTPFNSWQTPTPQAVAVLNQLNEGRSPRANAGVLPPPNGQAQHRQPGPALPHSPRENVHVAQMTNGYSPGSHTAESARRAPNPGFGFPFASVRPPINDPREVEREAWMDFYHTHGRQPDDREYILDRQRWSHPSGIRQHHNGISNNRSDEGRRVNGGASESPSVQNLLS